MHSGRAVIVTLFLCVMQRSMYTVDRVMLIVVLTIIQVSFLNIRFHDFFIVNTVVRVLLRKV